MKLSKRPSNWPWGGKSIENLGACNGNSKKGKFRISLHAIHEHELSPSFTAQMYVGASSQFINFDKKVTIINSKGLMGPHL